jgi:hypothetical protein
MPCFILCPVLTFIEKSLKKNSSKAWYLSNHRALFFIYLHKSSASRPLPLLKNLLSFPPFISNPNKESQQIGMDVKETIKPITVYLYTPYSKIFTFFFFLVLEFELRAFTLSYSTSTSFVMVFCLFVFWDRLCKLFAWGWLWTAILLSS